MILAKNILKLHSLRIPKAHPILVKFKKIFIKQCLHINWKGFSEKANKRTFDIDVVSAVCGHTPASPLHFRPQHCSKEKMNGTYNNTLQTIHQREKHQLLITPHQRTCSIIRSRKQWFTWRKNCMFTLLTGWFMELRLHVCWKRDRLGGRVLFWEKNQSSE